MLDTVSFTDLSVNSPTQWAWEILPDTITYLNGTDSTSQNPQVKFNAIGFFTVSLTASNPAGSNTETKMDYIEVEAISPEADFEADTTVVLIADTVLFTDLSTNFPTEWEWEIDPETFSYLDETDSNSQNPKIGFDEAGYYTISLTATNTAGSDSELKLDYIEVFEELSITATAEPDEICLGDTVYLDAEVSGGNGNFVFEWSSDPSGFVSNEQSPLAIPQETTTYFVNVSDDLQESEDAVVVTVNPLPVITLGDWPEILCNQEEPPVQLTADPEGGIFSGEVTPEGIFTPENAPIGWNVITYVFIDENNCGASAQDSIFVDECVGINTHVENVHQLVIFPNPNSGEFVVESKLTIQHLEIINQTGHSVYSKNVGKRSVKVEINLVEGIYYIRASFKDKDGILTVSEKMIIR